MKYKMSVLYIVVPILFSLIALNLGYGLISRSFVYSYGGAKVWVFITTNDTWTLKPDLNYTLYFEIYLESSGNNIGVFINRVTLNFRGTGLRQLISPNITLQSAGQSWTWNVTLKPTEEEFGLYPGQSSTFNLDFEVRYDTIDSSGTHWHYRVSDYITTKVKNPFSTTQPWTILPIVFLSVLSGGLAVALIILWIKIRKYKKTNGSRAP